MWEHCVKNQLLKNYYNCSIVSPQYPHLPYPKIQPNEIKKIFREKNNDSRKFQKRKQICCISNYLHNIYIVTRILCNLDMHWVSLIAQLVNNLPAMQETRVGFLGLENPLEKEMATHSSILAWRIPRIEEPGRLQSMGSQE